MTGSAPLLSMRNVSVDYRLRGNRVLRAVTDVSFDVDRAEVFGIIGESGSGKTSLGRSIVGLVRPTGGQILHDGLDISALGRDAFSRHQRDFGYIYQDANAALNPRMAIGASVREPLDILNELSTAEKNRLVREELERVGLGPEYAARFPHELSGGQKQRVNIARALIVKPRLLVCDEVVAALDVSIQADVLNLFSDLQRDLDLAYLFISHDLRVVAHVSDRVAVMYLGRIVEMGRSESLLRAPSHPYTKALLSAEPRIELKGDRAGERIVLKGEIPSAIDPPTGCPFRTSLLDGKGHLRRSRASVAGHAGWQLRCLSCGRRPICGDECREGRPSHGVWIMTGAKPPEWDYIIVGAGSAGCVLANRLSADPATRVLLIEAGPSDRGFLVRNLVRMPRGFGRTLFDPALTYSYTTEPQGRIGRRFVWVRGRLVGGCSAINGMIYSRGQRQDCQEWLDHGCTGWGPDDFQRGFDAIELRPGQRASQGMPIRFQDGGGELSDAVMAAAGRYGLKRVETLDWLQDDEGISFTPCNILDGRRVSAAEAFLRPAMRRRNLELVTDTSVDRILFDGQRAVGALARQGEGYTEYRSRGEVIVCGGTLESPRLLQLSGIGDAKSLAAVGVPLVHHSPEVGRNMRDHKPMRLQYRLARPLSYNRHFSGWRLWGNILRYAVARSGYLASTYDINGFARSRPEFDRTDLQFAVSAYSLVPGSKPMDFEAKHGVSVFFYPLRSTSLGTVMLASPDPKVAPVVDPNNLATDYDRRTTIDSLRFLRGLFAQQPLASMVVEEIDPGPAVLSDEEILAACEKHPPAAHTTGTCRMGADEQSVVDPDLCVRGVQGLRVVDASIFPTSISGNTMAITMAAAWLAADRIIGRPGDGGKRRMSSEHYTAPA